MGFLICMGLLILAWKTDYFHTIQNLLAECDFLLVNVDATDMQWHLTYTVEPHYSGHFGGSMVYIEVSTIQRSFVLHRTPFGPQKAVCYREVFAIGGVYYKRFHHILYNIIHSNMEV